MIETFEFQRDFEGFLGRHTAQNSRLAASLVYALRSPGKRLRPRFALESASVLGLSNEAAQNFAYAIELVHLFSLIHDDLPCMDDDDFRRGEPTIHKKFDEATALLAGDALLSLSFEAFAECAPFVKPAAFVKALQYFSRAIGPLGMIGGQCKELELGSSVDQHSLLQIQDLKTGALFRAALIVPYILFGVNEMDPKYQEVLTYASDFGFAFQIADDLDDEAQDQKDGTKNILSTLGRDAAKKMAVDRLLRTSVAKNYTATDLLFKKLTS
jgi:geranylgeranyl pyrophosphate synthase